VDRLIRTLVRGGHIMEQLNRTPYEAPMILDTFDALEVMGSAEGLIVIGQGSQAAG
jgi:hypothetical protein